jgi:hypothetical protein
VAELGKATNPWMVAFSCLLEQALQSCIEYGQKSLKLIRFLLKAKSIYLILVIIKMNNLKY